MPNDPTRTIAILLQAIAVCRGMLYSARTGDASRGEIEAILGSTGHDALRKLIGNEALLAAIDATEHLPAEDRDALLAISDYSYDSPLRKSESDIAPE
jgi:hypothetical protein